MDSVTPTTLVIIGITGDLAKRKLLPAIEAIARAGALPKDFRIIGTTRQADMTALDVCGSATPYVRDNLELFSMDTDDAAEYTRLALRLTELEQGLGPTQRLFYLSVPPSAVRGIVEHLGTSGLAKRPTTKLLLEKPFGTDLASATDLVTHLSAHFAPGQVYRIDHYLAKQMVQNLIVFREYNSLVRHTWSNAFIERIEIVASETIGIEGRAHFYEQTGALQDVVQSLPRQDWLKIDLAQARVHHGLVISGDRFISQSADSAELQRRLPHALAVEMECAAMAQVCHDYGVPMAAVRTISDRADDAAHVDFAQFIHSIASSYSAAVLDRLLRHLPR